MGLLELAARVHSRRPVPHWQGSAQEVAGTPRAADSELLALLKGLTEEQGQVQREWEWRGVEWGGGISAREGRR